MTDEDGVAFALWLEWARTSWAPFVGYESTARCLSVRRSDGRIVSLTIDPTGLERSRESLASFAKILRFSTDLAWHGLATYFCDAAEELPEGENLATFSVSEWTGGSVQPLNASGRFEWRSSK